MHWNSHYLHSESSQNIKDLNEKFRNSFTRIDVLGELQDELHLLGKTKSERLQNGSNLSAPVNYRQLFANQKYCVLNLWAIINK